MYSLEFKLNSRRRAHLNALKLAVSTKPYTLPSQTPGDEPARNTMNSAIDTTDIVATALNALQLVYGVWTLTDSRAPDVISHA